MNTPKKTTIKISGEQSAVLYTLRKIEQLFPLYLESKIYENTENDGVHVFLSIPAVLEAAT